MESKEWTVKELMEALKRFPLEARFTTRWAHTAREQSGKRNTSRPGAHLTIWECCWIDRSALRNRRGLRADRPLKQAKHYSCSDTPPT